MAVLLLTIRFLLFDIFIAPSLNLQGNSVNDMAWRHTAHLLLLYYFFMTLIINFINQVNKKYGPGVVLPLLFGKYRKPQEEKRIFLFMDLKSSTTIAEKLGHLKYSSFIRDCFFDINAMLFRFQAQVYQYAGDEIIVTWPESEGLKDRNCIRFYFACKQQFLNRQEYYISNYGLLPEFKAGVHSGMVTAVEIGEIKRDIAYHGDTLNIASRIQGVCNEYKKSFLASESLVQKLGEEQKDNRQNIRYQPLGMILLKGKTKQVGIVSIESATVEPVFQP
jgi:adenylate cyclase